MRVCQSLRPVLKLRNFPFRGNNFLPAARNFHHTHKMADENLLLIPGPILVSEKVREAQSIQSLAHTSPEFINIFRPALQNLRKLFKSTNAKDQGLVVSGSGTLGWDIAASNIVYPGEKVLLLSTGFFSDSFAECLRVYGADVTVITAPLGDVVPAAEIEAALQKEKYAAIVVTHVDTSTAVVQDIASISAIVKATSPDTLIVVDGVCSVGVEDIEFSQWGLDYVLSASQKAIGVPSGLFVGFISERAIAKALNREVTSTFFASLKKWLPILQNYEAGKPSYFATPAIQLVNALRVSLEEILAGGLDERFAKHHQTSSEFKSRLQNELGLKLVSVNEKVSANGLSAVYFPEGISGPEFIGKVYKKGIVIAGGIHKAIAPKYFRVGHMGISAIGGLGHTDRAFEVIKESLEELGYKK